VAQRITRLAIMAGGVVLPSLAEAASAFLAAGRELTPAQRGGLQQAARALAEGKTEPMPFCAQAAGICGVQDGAAAARLHEQLASELAPNSGVPSLVADVAQSYEVRLVSDYPAAWLLPALRRSGLAHCFPKAAIAYVAGLGGFAGMFDALISGSVLAPGHTLWVDSHSLRTSEALRKGVDATIFVDARRFRRDLGLWRLIPLPA
jgi:hypothetical protein